MSPAPSHIETLFLATVAALAAFFLYGQWRLADAPGPARLRALGVGLALVALWLGVAAALAASGAIADFSRLPPPFLLMMLGYASATVGLAFSPLGTRLVRRAPIAALVGFQVFRVPVEIFLHEAYRHGLVPVQMTWSGLNFDVVSGVTAAALGLYAWRREPPRALVLAWNGLGLALLATIVVVAFFSTPTPLRVFTSEPANTLVATFPYVWLPTFLVQAALFGHLLVLRWTARRG